MSVPDKAKLGSGPGDYRTPPDLWRQIERRYSLNYDAFSSHENALCHLHSTECGTYYRHEDGSASKGSSEDGLTFSWKHSRVWVQPPYGRGWLQKVVEKCVAERNKADIIVALLPVDTGTEWFQLLLQYADVEFLPKRVKFIHPDEKCKEDCTHALGEPNPNPPSANCIAVFRRDWIVP